MVGKYSIVVFNDQTFHNGEYYVEEIINGLLQLSLFPRMVNPNEVHEKCFDDLSTQDLVNTQDQIQKLADVLKREIRRRAYDCKSRKMNSKYFNDDFEVRHRDKKPTRF